MVTAHDRELLAQRQRELPPVLDGFVVKPVTASMLFDAVAEAAGAASAAGAGGGAGAAAPGRVRLLLVDDNRPTSRSPASCWATRARRWW
jgi:hypothetical protein